MKTTQPIGKLIKLINRLTNFAFTVRHRVGRRGEVISSLQMAHYSFSRKQQAKLIEEYGLDLHRFTKVEPYQITPAVLAKIKQQKESYPDKVFTNFDSASALTQCKDLQESVDRIWKPSSRLYKKIKTKLRAQYGEDHVLIIAELSYDPEFADCYRESMQPSERPKNVELANDFWNNRLQIYPEALVTFIEGRDLSELDRHWLYHRYLQGDPKSIVEPIKLGILPLYLDYQSINWVEITTEELIFLDAQGFDTFNTDKFGKTALYYAVKNRRIDLITFMLEQNYPFSGFGTSQDPLHLILASWKNAYDAQDVKSILPLLMRWQLQLDKHHFSRMKLLKLRDRGTYDWIITQFPQLTVDEKTLYPQGACN